MMNNNYFTMSNGFRHPLSSSASIIPAETNSGTINNIVGDHELTFDNIYNLVLNIFLDKFTMIGTFPTASQVLRKALNIGIKGDKFIQVKLGDIRVLICNDYLGKNNQNKVHDFFIVDGVPTLFIFSDPLTNEHVKRDIRVSRIMELFSILVQLMNTQEYYNLVDSIYAKVIESAPVVMTVKLIKAVYERNFVYDKDWNPDLYANMGWFNQDVVDAVYQFGMTELLNYGAIVLHIDAYCNEE